jgi:hypothetical protein
LKTAESKKKGENLMNAVINRNSESLLVHAERIREGLQRLGKDCSVWSRKREEKARLQLGETYIHNAVLDHLEIDCSRFSKLIGKVQGNLRVQQRPSVPPPQGALL